MAEIWRATLDSLHNPGHHAPNVGSQHRPYLSIAMDAEEPEKQLEPERGRKAAEWACLPTKEIAE